jgi:hypothetical protein
MACGTAASKSVHLLRAEPRRNQRQEPGGCGRTGTNGPVGLTARFVVRHRGFSGQHLVCSQTFFRRRRESPRGNDVQYRRVCAVFNSTFEFQLSFRDPRAVRVVFNTADAKLLHAYESRPERTRHLSGWGAQGPLKHPGHGDSPRVDHDVPRSPNSHVC